jgi:hypothetical protein
MKTFMSAASMQNRRQSDDLPETLSIEQARDVLVNLEHVPEEILIHACEVIEIHGTAPERADFQALREVFQNRGD